MKLRNVSLVVWCLAVFGLQGELTFAQTTLRPQNPSGVYKVGEKVQWHVELRAGTSPPTTQPVAILRHNGVGQLRQETLDLSTGTAAVEVTLDSPGGVLLEVRGAPGAVGGRGRGGGAGGGGGGRVLDGALISPELIQPSMPRPDDFDAWWTKKIAALDAVPPNPNVEAVDSGNATVSYAKVTLDNINGRHIYGHIARPAGGNAGAAGKKYPALLILQWAGIYGLPKTNVTSRAAQGWLAMNIMPHDLPLDQPPAYYTQLNAGPLGSYYRAGNDDREKSYFLPMYLSCYRAVEYLASQPDWDGKTLVVMGTSMGGQQSLMVAGLNGRVTAVCVNVPSSCDLTGPAAKPARAAGFPDWASQAASRNNPQILETGRYFDPINFAPRITCPALVALGLYDETSPPVGIYATFNLIKNEKKEVVVMHSGHQNNGNSQAPWGKRSEEWLAALMKGEG